MGSLIRLLAFFTFAIFCSTGVAAEKPLKVLASSRLSNINIIEQVDPLLWRLRPLSFKTLIEWDASKADFKPALASTWKFSSGGRVLIFELDPEARWQDGKPVRAEDVAFSVGLHAHPESKSIYLTMYQEFIEKVLVKSEKSVEFHLKNSSYYHLVSLGLYLQIYPKHIYSGAKGELVWPKKWVGAGDFELTRFVPDRYMHFKALKKDQKDLRVEFVPSRTQRFEEVKAGKADWAQLNWREVLPELKSKKHKSLLYPDELKDLSGSIWLLLNHKNPHLAQTQVRQAMMYGFDRKRVNRQLFDDFLKIGSGYWPKAHAYAAQSRTSYDFDAAKAAALLKAAGYEDKDKNGVLEKNIQGKSQELSFKILLMQSEDEALADLFAQSMRGLGIKVELERKGAQAASEQVTSGNYDAYILTIQKFYQDMNLRYQFHSGRKQKWPVMKLEPKAQVQIDRLLEQIEMSFSSTERRPKAQQVDEILAAEVPSLFWFEIPQEYWLKAPKASSPPPF